MGFDTGYKYGLDLIDKLGEKEERDSKKKYYDSLAEKNRGAGQAYDESTKAGAGKLRAGKAIDRDLYPEGEEGDKMWEAQKDLYKKAYPQAGTRNKAARAAAARIKADAKGAKHDAQKKAIENKFLGRKYESINDKQLLRQAEAETLSTEAKADNATAIAESLRIKAANDGKYRAQERQADLEGKKAATSLTLTQVEAAKATAAKVISDVKFDNLARTANNAVLTEVNETATAVMKGEYDGKTTSEIIAHFNDLLSSLPEDNPKQIEWKKSIGEVIAKKVEKIRAQKSWANKKKVEVRESVINDAIQAGGPSEQAYMSALKQTNPEKYNERRTLYLMLSEAAEMNNMPPSVFHLPQFKGQIYVQKQSDLKPFHLNPDGTPMVDANNEPIKNMVLDQAQTFRQWEQFKKHWKETYPVQKARSIRSATEGVEQLRGGTSTGGTGLGELGGGTTQHRFPRAGFPDTPEGEAAFIKANTAFDTGEQKLQTETSGSLAQIDSGAAAGMFPQQAWDEMTTHTVEDVFKQLDEVGFDMLEGQTQASYEATAATKAATGMATIGAGFAGSRGVRQRPTDQEEAYAAEEEEYRVDNKLEAAIQQAAAPPPDVAPSAQPADAQTKAAAAGEYKVGKDIVGNRDGSYTLKHGGIPLDDANSFGQKWKDVVGKYAPKGDDIYSIIHPLQRGEITERFEAKMKPLGVEGAGLIKSWREKRAELTAWTKYAEKPPFPQAAIDEKNKLRKELEKIEAQSDKVTKELSDLNDGRAEAYRLQQLYSGPENPTNHQSGDVNMSEDEARKRGLIK